MKRIPSRIFSVLLPALLLLPVAVAAATPGAPTLKNGWTDLPESSLTSHAAIVMDMKSGATLYFKQPDLPWPAASLTKLMTSVIFVEQGIPMSRVASIENADEVGGGRLRVDPGTKLTAKDLLYSALVGSANNAAMAMMRISGLGLTAFLRDMNIRAATIGMSSTHYADPAGMEVANKTTARDMATLLRYAFGNATLRRAGQTANYRFSTIGPVIKKSIKNTNGLLLDNANDLWIVAGKTGYLEEAQYNLAIRVQTMQRSKELAVVVLGADTKQHSFDEAERLAKWAWNNYAW